MRRLRSGSRCRPRHGGGAPHDDSALTLNDDPALTLNDGRALTPDGARALTRSA